MGRYNEALEELRRTDELAHGFFLVQTEAYLCEQFLSGVIDAEVLRLLRLLQRLRNSGASHSEQATAIRWRWLIDNPAREIEAPPTRVKRQQRALVGGRNESPVRAP